MEQNATKKITAKTLIRALVVITLIVWVMTYTYMFSSKPSLAVYDDGQTLQFYGDRISKEIAAIAKFHPHSEQLMSLYCLLCEIKLCQKDPLSGKNDLPALFNIADGSINNYNRSLLNIFIGNIYRDYGNYDLAKASYLQALKSATIDTISSSRKDERLDGQTNKARSLNNLGVLYYLQGKTSLNKRDSYTNYLIAKDYFAQANGVVPINQDVCLGKTIDSNMHQCLWELKFINQF